ncbi:MAG: hypothetical protein E7I13_05395 [Negativicoccus succinicivorans]|nr:hypothetical protein [Negativicoccus succinicivorans]
MKNKEWYRYDAKENKYVLTEKASPKAQESYREFYAFFKGREGVCKILTDFIA